jgi:hypothetical protein
LFVTSLSASILARTPIFPECTYEPITPFPSRVRVSTRRISIFSPILIVSSEIRSFTVVPALTGTARRASTVAIECSTALSVTVFVKAKKSVFFAAKSVSIFTSTREAFLPETTAPITPSAATRDAFLERQQDL